MKKNMGTIDRALRAVLAVVIIVLFFMGSISGTAAIVLGVFSGILLLTSATGVCPLYGPFGITTMKKEEK